MTHSSKPAAASQAAAETRGDIAAKFAAAIDQIAADHHPSRTPFFQHLRELSPAAARDPQLLGQIHLIYQSAMHATRAAVYYLPHLDSPAMRKRKLQIFIDDDGLPGGDTHHYQLTRAFQHIGAKLVLEDEDFGSATELCRHLDADTSRFVQLAGTLYARSLGPWCVVELMSDWWMRSLADSLAAHFPEIHDEPYFAECFSQGVEERHAAEAMEVTSTVLQARPELYSETVLDARLMAEALDGVWRRLDTVVQLAAQKTGSQGETRVSAQRKQALA
jgi:pyrroloquinoline quinone (PQQ) biosynthesis protein C